MDNKIIFLGTAGDSSVYGKQYKASGGIILQLGDVQLHLDPGPGTLVRADQYGVNLRANTAVLVSNSSLKNCNDINAVIDAMTHSGLDKKGVLIANNTVVNGNDKQDAYLTKMHRNYVERIIVMESGKRIGIEDMEIHALPAKTQDSEAVGYKIISPHSTIVYSGDSVFRNDVVRNYRHSDILILNIASPESTKPSTSFSSEDVVKIIKDVNPKLAVITGFGMKMLKADPLYEARKIQSETGVQVVAAKDGMVINVASFSAKVRQKTLRSFSEAKASTIPVVAEINEVMEPKEEDVQQDLGSEVESTQDLPEDSGDVPQHSYDSDDESDEFEQPKASEEE
ncbi:MBL fold metallo-hydrolase [Nanoarchaeota archaeon]